MRKRSEVQQEPAMSNAQDRREVAEQETNPGVRLPAQAILPPAPAPPRIAESAGETIVIVWGEEKYGPPGSFSSCTVGPFTLTMYVKAGDSVSGAYDRGMRWLAEIAEVERQRKLKNFVNKLNGVKGQS
jgi:hypothetical protein